jgi:uncharacterized protein YndB with AHSA1/START domain
MLKRVLTIVGVAVVLFLAFVATRPGRYRVERSAVVAAPAESVYGAVADLRRWAEWSPWEKLDPQMKKEYAGAAGAVSSTYYWNGNKKVGEGRLTLIEGSAPSRVVYRLEFLRPWTSVATTEFTFAPEAEATRVTWAMLGENGFAAKFFGLFMNMDSMIGKDFEKGLASLKEDVERGAAH